MQLLLSAALHWASGELGVSLSVSRRIGTVVAFAAEGIALAATILFGPRLWPGIFLGQLLLALGNGLAWPLAAVIAAISSAAAVLVAQALAGAVRDLIFKADSIEQIGADVARL